MQRERITDSIFVFSSDLYAQVTAGVVLTGEGALLVDTLAFPRETQAIKRFIEERLRQPVRYVVNTHYHADHTTGTCFFPDAKVIAHARCRDLLDTRGRASLDAARETSPDMDAVELVLPDVTFEHDWTLELGGKTIRFWASPGHSPDSITCLVEDEQVLFAGDTMMPIPYFVDGDIDDLRVSLAALQEHAPETIIQGHGEVVLRGEVKERIRHDLRYLDRLEEKIEAAQQKRDPEKAFKAISLESCGKSRVLLNGLAQQLHQQNIDWLRRRMENRPQLQTGL